jgi:hypothetical protein
MLHAQYIDMAWSRAIWTNVNIYVACYTSVKISVACEASVILTLYAIQYMCQSRAACQTSVKTTATV